MEPMLSDFLSNLNKEHLIPHLLTEIRTSSDPKCDILRKLSDNTLTEIFGHYCKSIVDGVPEDIMLKNMSNLKFLSEEACKEVQNICDPPRIAEVKESTVLPKHMDLDRVSNVQ